MEDYDFCIQLAQIACDYGFDSAIIYADDSGISYEEALFDLEFMGVIR